jgi:IS5 family transposase
MLKNDALITLAHQEYLQLAQAYLDKARQTLALIEAQLAVPPLAVPCKLKIEGFMAHADRQIDQIRWRVILGVVIAHGEKVFSIFEPHTEWICKGKAGVAVELGVKVCILEDQHQFILHYQVMQQ